MDGNGATALAAGVLGITRSRTQAKINHNWFLAPGHPWWGRAAPLLKGRRVRRECGASRLRPPPPSSSGVTPGRKDEPPGGPTRNRPKIIQPRLRMGRAAAHPLTIRRPFWVCPFEPFRIIGAIGRRVAILQAVKSRQP